MKCNPSIKLEMTYVYLGEGFQQESYLFVLFPRGTEECVSAAELATRSLHLFWVLFHPKYHNSTPVFLCITQL